MISIKRLLFCTTIPLLLNGCAVVAVADAVVSVGATVVSTTAKVGAAAVGTAVDVTRAGVHAVTNSSQPKLEPTPAK